MKLIRKIASFFVLLCFTTAIAQTTTCAPIVEQALAAVQQDYSTLGRNQACYGFVSLQATPRQNVQNFSFTKDGDLVNVADIETIRLSRLDTVHNTCLLYTSDAADEEDSVDLGGRRIIKK